MALDHERDGQAEREWKQAYRSSSFEYGEEFLWMHSKFRFSVLHCRRESRDPIHHISKGPCVYPHRASFRIRDVQLSTITTRERNPTSSGGTAPRRRGRGTRTASPARRPAPRPRPPPRRARGAPSPPLPPPPLAQNQDDRIYIVIAPGQPPYCGFFKRITGAMSKDYRCIFKEYICVLLMIIIVF